MNEEDKKLIKDTIKILEVLQELDKRDETAIAESLRYFRDYCKPK